MDDKMLFNLFVKKKNHKFYLKCTWWSDFLALTKINVLLSLAERLLWKAILEDAGLTVKAVSATLPCRGLQQAPDDILTTAPLQRSTIPGRTSRVTRVDTTTFLFTWSTRSCSGVATRLRGKAKVSCTQFTTKPISLPLKASFTGLLSTRPREKSARTTSVSTP